MVHYRSTAILLATTLSVTQIALGGGNTAPTFHILTGDSEMACSPDQVAVLKTRFTEAVTLAKAASGALDVNGAETSAAFTDFLGNAVAKEMEAQHYAPVTRVQSADVKSVTSDEGHKPGVKATAPANEMLFMCWPAKTPPCTTQDGKGTTLQALAYANEQTLRLCPLFFGNAPVYNPQTKKDIMFKPLSIAEGKASYLRGQNAYAMGALVLLHEMQHLASVIGEHTVRDLWIKKGAPNEVVPRPTNILAKSPGIVGVYAKKDCIGLPKDQKRLNAQNFAYFALDVSSNPARAQPVGTTSDASKVSKDAPKDAPKDKDAAKTPRRFEAIYQRRANKDAKAELGV